jgi:hypothetical protein
MAAFMNEVIAHFAALAVTVIRKVQFSSSVRLQRFTGSLDGTVVSWLCHGLENSGGVAEDNVYWISVSRHIHLFANWYSTL